MAKGYKPERPVTSDKIRKEIVAVFDKKYERKYYTAANSWKRLFKRRLPESRGFVRGFEGYASGQGLEGNNKFYALAISDETDTKLDSVYLVDNADEECKRLGVNELMFAED